MAEHEQRYQMADGVREGVISYRCQSFAYSTSVRMYEGKKKGKQERKKRVPVLATCGDGIAIIDSISMELQQSCNKLQSYCTQLIHDIWCLIVAGQNAC